YAKRLHRLGHHLHVADREVEVEATVPRAGRGVKRGDRAGLDDEKLPLGKAPLDVLLAAVMGLNLLAETCELEDLTVRDRLALLVFRRERLGFGSTARHRADGDCLSGDSFRNDPRVAHLIEIGGDEAADQSLTEPETRVDRNRVAATRNRVGREHDPRRLGK